MGEIININPMASDEIAIDEMTQELLIDVRAKSEPKGKSLSLPIEELSTLGAGVSSLIPTIKAIAQTTGGTGEVVYKLVNSGAGDALKVAKDGNLWGALKTAEGSSKMAKFTEVTPGSAADVIKNVDPALMMMAVALFSIEKDLGEIEAMQKQILSFLEIEKESEIEADVETLTKIITSYKHNWDNEHYVASNHKMVCDIQRTARKNMIAYQKQAQEMVKDKQWIVAGSKVNSTLGDMLKKFKYYRLSLYTFALSEMAEIMLSENYKEENISVTIEEIRKSADEYRKLFTECSEHLEQLSRVSLERNAMKVAGIASKSVGKLLGNIPKVKETSIEKVLTDVGDDMQEHAQEISKEVISSFAEVSNPNVAGFVERLEDMRLIYNHTSEIGIDNNGLYLVAE